MRSSQSHRCGCAYFIFKLDHWEKLIPLNSIITPHQGEFDRLFGTFNNHIERINFMKEFSFENKIVIVLKGADTVT
ncbi:MAG: hypothetical protein IPO33_07615, partial [Saprospiraceae bacterium]|nr:hypothetical protein [Candidatus Brachybacter algidus]